MLRLTHLGLALGNVRVSRLHEIYMKIFLKIPGDCVSIGEAIICDMRAWRIYHMVKSMWTHDLHTHVILPQAVGAKLEACSCLKCLYML